MNVKTKITPVLLLLTLGFSAYLESPDSFMNKAYVTSKSEPVMAQMEKEPTPPQIPILEERLEKREKVGNYIFETYREYEISKDKSGNVIKAVPTSKTDFLKYRDYSKK
ncbi:MAG: hypothetical protein Q8898_14215 [Bacillota bacterium]|nr:hypothetical protein [Bacillota bacterium]